jgi:hypothetical protein
MLQLHQTTYIVTELNNPSQNCQKRKVLKSTSGELIEKPIAARTGLTAHQNNARSS